MRLLNKLTHSLSRVLTTLLLACIQGYRLMISPLLGKNCRFHPTCSEYASDAIKEQGATIGVYLSIRRLLKCHPWHPGGIDPVPPKTTKTNSNLNPQTEI